ncbi:MAG: hypothetical protein ACT443_10080, partial [Gemmatimonadota bacterium]
QLDPNFQRVQEMQQETQVLEKASGEAPAEVGQQAQAPAAGTGDLKRTMTNQINSNPASDLTQRQTTPTTQTNTIQNQTGNINNAQGQTNSISNAARATIRLVITRPGA